MSYDVNAIAASQQAAAIAAPAPSTQSAALVSAVVMSDEPVTVDMIPAIPPSGVLDAVRAASATYDKLAASGHEVHFTTDAQNGRVAIQVLDMSGASVGTMSPSAALHVATGGALHITPTAKSSAAATAKGAVAAHVIATARPATRGTLA